MFNKAIILTPLILALSFSAYTNEKPQHQDRQTWISNMQSTLPKLLCQSDQHFMQCYQVTEAECLELTNMVVKACLNSASIGIPLKVDQAAGQHWGQLIGRCTYDLYTKYMQSKIKALPACHETPKNEENS